MIFLVYFFVLAKLLCSESTPWALDSNVLSCAMCLVFRFVRHVRYVVYAIPTIERRLWLSWLGWLADWLCVSVCQLFRRALFMHIWLGPDGLCARPSNRGTAARGLNGGLSLVFCIFGEARSLVSTPCVVAPLLSISFFETCTNWTGYLDPGIW